MYQPEHYVFHCKNKNCGKPIALHAETLGQPFGSPTLRTSHVESVGVACFHCKHVKNYSLNKNSPYFDPKGRTVFQPQILATEIVGLFECAGGSCRPLTPLVSPVTATMTAEERANEIASWIWDDFHCFRGDKIDPRISFKCITPECGFVLRLKMSDLVVGSKVSCLLGCKQDYRLTAEQVKRLKTSFLLGKQRFD